MLLSITCVYQLCKAFEYYAMEYLTSHLYFLGIFMSYQEILLISGIFYGIPWESVAFNYFILCHRKYSGQQDQCDMSMAHDGKVGFNTVEHKAAILYSDWLYFIQHDIKYFIKFSSKFDIQTYTVSGYRNSAKFAQKSKVV